MKSKKGFTMIELLGTIVILGILMAIAIPAVQTWIEKGKLNYYNSQRHNLESAAKSYTDNNKIIFNEDGDYQDVSLQTLIDQKFISGVRDSDRQDCTPKLDPSLSPEEKKQQPYTFVRIIKQGERLKYTAHLWCPAKRDDPLEVSNVDVEIEIAGNNNNEIIIHIIPKTSILSKFSYTVYKGNNAVVKKSSEISEDREDPNISLVQDVSSFITNGVTNFKCVVKVFDNDGNVSSVDEDIDFDNTSSSVPKCYNVKAFKTTFYDDKTYVRYDFNCSNCDKEYYSGEEQLTSDSVQIPIGTGHFCSITNDMITASDEDDIVLADEYPEKGYSDALVSNDSGCPMVSQYSTKWKKGSLEIKYALSKGTLQTILINSSSSGSILRDNPESTDEKPLPQLKFKNMAATDVEYDSADPNSLIRTKTYDSNKTGKYYFVVKVVERDSEGTTQVKYCPDPAATEDHRAVYGPYRLDNSGPVLIGKIVNSTPQYKLTVKFTAKDAESGIRYLYVNESEEVSDEEIINKGIKMNKKRYTYKKTKNYSSGYHTFYAHMMDNLGNVSHIKIGKEKSMKFEVGCKYLGTVKKDVHGMEYLNAEGKILPLPNCFRCYGGWGNHTLPNKTYPNCCYFDTYISNGVNQGRCNHYVTYCVDDNGNVMAADPNQYPYYSGNLWNDENIFTLTDKKFLADY